MTMNPQEPDMEQRTELREAIERIAHQQNALGLCDVQPYRGFLRDVLDAARKFAALEPLLRELCEARGKATSGPWKQDIMANVGDNWLIGTGFGRDTDGTQPILCTDGVRGSELEGGEASDDVNFCATAANITARIREVVGE